MGLSLLDLPINSRYALAKATGQLNNYKYLSFHGNAALKSRAIKKGLLFGSAVTKNSLSNDDDFADHFRTECNILVSENELKWEALRPSPYTYNFYQADWLEQFARKNNLLFRGHTFVWHHALPGWFQSFVTKKNAERILREHITTVAGRYKDKMHSWDVVNEPIQPWDRQPGGLRNSP
jgi:endo-1,4-beta-xylanase